MNIDITLLEKQITTLGNQLNKPLEDSEREDIECLLNVLGDISDKLKAVTSCILIKSDEL
jgi:hypothetical protein